MRCQARLSACCAGHPRTRTRHAPPCAGRAPRCAVHAVPKPRVGGPRRHQTLVAGSGGLRRHPQRLLMREQPLRWRPRLRVAARAWLVSLISSDAPVLKTNHGRSASGDRGCAIRIGNRTRNRSHIRTRARVRIRIRIRIKNRRKMAMERHTTRRLAAAGFATALFATPLAWRPGVGLQCFDARMCATLRFIPWRRQATAGRPPPDRA